MNKRIVVTGGTKGIGRAVIEKFASHGFDVFTCARSARDLQQMKLDLEAQYPASRFYVKETDMADKQKVKDFCAFVNGFNGPIDVLVNNAGYFIPGELVSEAEGTLESMIETNLYSAYYTTRGLVENMKQTKSGHIFNLCSIASIKAYPNGGSYAISKFALLGFSKCLREELKQYGVRVTAVMPGATLTASWEGVDLPEERFMSSVDVADSIFAAYSLSARSVVEEIIIRPQLGDI